MKPTPDRGFKLAFKIIGVGKHRWTHFWMRYSGISRLGRIATRLATFGNPPYKGCMPLARFYPHGYISASVEICHDQFSFGRNVFLGDRVVVYQGQDGGSVDIGSQAAIHRDCIFETGFGGSISIGEKTSIQNRGQLSAYVGDIVIGRHVQIAPGCSFYPYNHGMDKHELISRQPLTSKGAIRVEDDAWIGVGVTILENVRVGKGAVVGANAVVTKDVPDFCVAAGNPALVIGERG
jgi:acetyltransferase-like isoleucine patch superfamily enzyme